MMMSQKLLDKNDAAIESAVGGGKVATADGIGLTGVAAPSASASLRRPREWGGFWTWRGSERCLSWPACR